jgi:hypothetical protein
MMRISIAALILSLAVGANAAEPGFYLGLGAGQAKYDDTYASQIRSAYTNAPGVNLRFEAVRLDDDSDQAWKVFGGYRFLPWLGAELAWQDLGQVKGQYRLATITGFTNTVIRAATAELDGPSLSVFAQYDFNPQWHGLARVGVMRTKFAYRETDVGITNPSTFSNDNSNNSTLLGLSVGYQSDAQWGLRLDWDRLLDVGKRFALDTTSNGEFESIDVVSISATYKFPN